MIWTIRLGAFGLALAAAVAIALHIEGLRPLDGRQLAVTVIALLTTAAISVGARGVAAALRTL